MGNFGEIYVFFKIGGAIFLLLNSVHSHLGLGGGAVPYHIFSNTLVTPFVGGGRSTLTFKNGFLHFFPISERRLECPIIIGLT